MRRACVHEHGELENGGRWKKVPLSHGGSEQRFLEPSTAGT